MVKQFNEMGMMVIYMSYYMEEVEYLCDWIGIIDQGEMIVIGMKNDLCSCFGGDIIIQFIVSRIDEVFFFVICFLVYVNDVIVYELEFKIDIFVVYYEKVVISLFVEVVVYYINLLFFQVQELNLECLFLNLIGCILWD